jgi:ubiquitin C-terminal hydrolase
MSSKLIESFDKFGYKIFEGRGMIGIPNIGGTSCFLNSIIQSLISIPELMKIVSFKQVKLNTQTNDKYVYISFGNLIICLLNNDRNNVGKCMEIFIQNFSLNKKFSCIQEQDTHEAMILLLECLINATQHHNQIDSSSSVDSSIDNSSFINWYNKNINIEKLVKKWDILSFFKKKKFAESVITLNEMNEIAKTQLESNYFKNQWSNLNDLFTGVFCEEITCDCKMSKYKFEPFISWSVPIFPLRIRESSIDDIPLTDCLDRYILKTKFDANNLYSCENCKKHTRAIHKSSIWIYPEIFIIHLKRFSKDN